MYIILTSKIGKFHSEIIGSSSEIETYHYYFHSELKAKFNIHLIDQDVKIKITDETVPITVNLISTKFLTHYDNIEKARLEIKSLVPIHSNSFQLTKQTP